MNRICLYFGAGNEKIAELLIKAGIDIDATSSIGCSAFHQSAYYGTTKVADLLIKAKAKLNYPYNYCYGNPPKLAEQSGHLEIFKQILSENGKFLKHGIIVDDLEDFINAVREGKMLELNGKINDRNNFIINLYKLGKIEKVEEIIKIKFIISIWTLMPSTPMMMFP